MKKYSFLAYIGIAALMLPSCIKEDVKSFTGTTVVEFDAAAVNVTTAGTTYPILTRIPTAARPLTTADSTLRRLNNKTIQIRINLVGPQSGKDETVGYNVFTTSPVPTVAFPATSTASQIPPSGQTPTRAAGTLTYADAVSGTHYSIASTGTITIPANSSFGYINVTILPSAATAGQARFLGLELNDLGSVKPNPNYKTVGLAIDQR